MKRLLSLFGAISLVGASTTSLVACDTQYTEDELKQLKAENQINTTNQEIKDNLEWIAPQEQPFNEVDNKYYYVIARNSMNNNWKLFKLKNYGEKGSGLKTDWGERPVGFIFTINNDILLATGNLLDNSTEYIWGKGKYYKNYIKSVYRWNGEEQNVPVLDIDENGNIKVNGE
ncbi:putative lipoprotein [Spiroplasma kunkelii CR2-3x]|uniref:Putative lipoprotein n=1 Tax=Spiroplasma kunkelii CR2-3x TaxID=273035 RepID=A0A0K2JFK2_SPIKU|nr:lipoprotein [Spiroplasma kunkelii]ALA97359.1 putative lipoprotein [Spiroplasma kunkelii CR2-3x]